MRIDAAIRAGDLAAVSELLRSGLDPNLRCPDGLTPLMIASGLGQAQMIDILLIAGADVIAIEPRMGATAIHKAVQSGNSDVIGLLLDHGAFIDQQSPALGHTPLMDAVLHKHAGAVSCLLNRGARTMIRNHWQQTAAELAKADGSDVIIGMIEARDRTDAERIAAMPLIVAVKAGDATEVFRLIMEGISINERLPMTGNLDDGYTALGLAVRDGHNDIVRILLDAGADVRQVIGPMKGTVLHEASFWGRADIARLLTQHRARAGAPAIEIDAQGPYNGMTALHDAAWHGHLDVAKALVQAGAALDLRSHAGLTPEELAVLYGYHELAEFLRQIQRAADGTREGTRDVPS